MCASVQETGKADLVATLQVLGASRIEAVLLDFLLHRGPCDTKTIVQATDLRQPEVSVGMRELRQRGWVDTEAVPRDGKGRPMNRYHLLAARGDVARFYRRAAEDRIAAFRAAVDGMVDGLGLEGESQRLAPPKTSAATRPRSRPTTRAQH